MVMVKESHTCQQFSAWNSPGLDHLPFLQLDQCIPPSTCTAKVALPEISVSILPGSNAGHQDAAVDALFKLPTLDFDVPNVIGNLYSKDSPCALLNRLGVTAKPIDATCTQKRFLIFDQSGNKTRLFFSSSLSHQNQIVASKIPACAYGSHEKLAAQIDEHYEEKWDENQLTDGEDEMFEDSEEINALLYSDGEEEYEDDEDDGGENDGENDEVTSTGHTPYITEDVHYKDKLFEKLDEEVASSDDLPKRRKLLDGGFKQPSLVGTEKLDCLFGYEDDVESSNACMKNCSDDIYSSKREKKIKIREALKTLESIIPGLKSKDPLFIIDKAITHLKLMKLEAESLGLGHLNPNGKLASFP